MIVNDPSPRSTPNTPTNTSIKYFHNTTKKNSPTTMSFKFVDKLAPHHKGGNIYIGSKY